MTRRVWPLGPGPPLMLFSRVEGRIAPGEEIKVGSEANPKRAFPVEVTELVPGAARTWTGGMPFGLFEGVRTYRLASQDDGTTSFEMRDEYTGPLVPLLWKTMPDLQPSFDKFARELKARSEGAR